MTSTTVLIVEDDWYTAKDTKRVLEELGYDVPVIDATGEDAIRDVEKHSPDLVLMDIVLKGDMDGIDAADQIHNRFNTPIVYVTAHADKTLMDRAKITEPFGYITKPFEAAELHTAIEIALYKHKMENQLRQAHKMEAIGILAGGIAHDFNNILGIIMGCTELSLHDTPKETPIHEYLTEALMATNRAKDLVKQILTFSRPDKQDGKPLAIGIIIEEALRMLRSSLPTTIEIRQNIEENAGLIMADHSQIHQIIMNLSTNAAHAMKESGGVLSVNVADIEIDAQSAEQHPDLESGPYVKLTVSDTGHGMESKVLERIFDPYYTTKGIGEGSGLGLSVVHGIVQNHKGAINVYSEYGKGTTFRILFPKIDFAEDRPEIKEEESVLAGTERILFVDDEPGMVITYKAMLEHLGYMVSIRTSSIEALEAFKSQPNQYDLVITDQTMPHLTGHMMAREMMTIRPDIPIILCTGHSDLINEDKAKEAGIQAFVMKPIAMAEIAKTIRAVLDREDDQT